MSDMRLQAAVRPVLAIALCVVLAGLADEWALRSWQRAGDRDETVARVVAFDEPIRPADGCSLSHRSCTPARPGPYLRSQLSVEYQHDRLSEPQPSSTPEHPSAVERNRTAFPTHHASG